MARRVGVLFAVFLTIFTVSINGQTLPEGPRSFVDTTYPTMTGMTINVPAGGDFQSALDSAQLGDTITLAAGATYNGNFTLNPKSGSGWIVIRTSAPDSSLPPQGNRISPSYSSVMPKIVTTNSSPAIQTSNGAHHYRLVGLEITVASGVSTNYGLVNLGTADTQTSLSQVPYNIILDRVYIHGQSNAGLSRGVALNSKNSAVIDSYISEGHLAGFDAQAIMCSNSPGPLKIANNYLSGAGENVLFGGSDPGINNLVPSDIEVRGNYFFKPTSWQSSSWTVKNIFELKNAQRILIDGNIFEHNWPNAQAGYSIVFTPRNQDGSAPWSVVQDVTFTHNIVRHVSSAVNMIGWDDIQPSQETKRILIKDNLFEDVSAANWGGVGVLFQIGGDGPGGIVDLTIDHNTAFQTGEVSRSYSNANDANTRYTYRNNLSPNNTYGVGGDNHYGDPLGTLSTYFPGYVFVKNILQGGSAAKYPTNNFFPAAMNDVGFVNVAGGDYHLATSSPYKNAGSDGKDIGANIDAVNSATAGAVNGNSSPPPPPPPPDTTPPTASVTAPANGATVSGTTTVTANASDNVGVVGVQFYLDGSTLGAEDTAAPYSVSWNTTTAANGGHTLTAKARDAAGNTTTSAAVSMTVSNAPPTQSPFTGTPFAVPGRFEAEDFDKGGEGLAYHDNVPGNAGGLYRTTEDVDIVSSPYAGGYVVNNFETGEWMEYTINVTSAGTYTMEVLVSSEYPTTSQFHISIDNVDKTGLITVPNTGLWTTFQWVGKSGISLTAGQHVLRLSSDVAYFNVDSLRLTQDSSPPDTTPPSIFITGPASGATLSGITTSTANASDNVGVLGVQFLLDGSPLGAEDTSSPYTYTWDTTQVVNGGHALTAKARDAAGNQTISATVNVTVSNIAPPLPTQLPYYGTPFAVPGRFEAEDFDKGGEGIAYHDLAPGNFGGLYRTTEDVDIVSSPYAGGYVVNNFQTGEWMEYTINLTSAGTYTMEVLASSEYPASQFHISIDNVDKTGLITVPNTGLWTTFQWVGKSGISLTAGQHVLRLSSDVEYFNVDALRLTQDSLPADTTPPSVSITVPLNGATVANTIPVTANASDNVGVVGVQFYVDSSPLGAEDTAAPYSVLWNTTTAMNGGHTLTARARDAAGNQKTSTAVTVTVSNTPPTQQQTPFTGTPFAVPGRFEAEDFDKGGEGIAYHDMVPGNAGGLYRLTEDVDIISPYAGGYVVDNFQTGEWLEYTINVTLAATYTIEALVSSEYPATSKFHISIDDVDKTGPITVPNTLSWWTFVWLGKGGISLTAGQHVLRITADVEYFNFDAVRLTRESSPAAPGPDLTAPSVSITAPTDAATVTGITQVTADASDNVSVAGVQFYLDGALLGDEDTSAPFAATWDTTLASNGFHMLTAVARDAAGNTATSAAIQVSVINADVLPPTVAITAPSDAATVSGSVQMTASASDNIGVSGVQFYLDGLALGAEDSTAPYSITWDTTAAANGSHALTAVARDAAGNSKTSAAIQVTVANSTTGPTVAVTSPISGSTLSGAVPVGATVSKMSAIGVRFYLDGNPLGIEDNFAPFEVSWDTTQSPNGSHKLTAVARDLTGKVIFSAPVTVSVLNAPLRRRARH